MSESSGSGPAIAAVVIVALLVLAGFGAMVGFSFLSARSLPRPISAVAAPTPATGTAPVAAATLSSAYGYKLTVETDGFRFDAQGDPADRQAALQVIQDSFKEWTWPDHGGSRSSDDTYKKYNGPTHGTAPERVYLAMAARGLFPTDVGPVAWNDADQAALAAVAKDLEALPYTQSVKVEKTDAGLRIAIAPASPEQVDKALEHVHFGYDRSRLELLQAISAWSSFRLSGLEERSITIELGPRVYRAASAGLWQEQQP